MADRAHQGVPHPAPPIHVHEAPLTLAYLRNTTAVAKMGAIILPPVPAFYLKPVNLTEIIEQIASRAVDGLKICDPMARQWHPLSSG
ncbi:hypothetical protein [Ruegeria sp. HKCCA6837]|uniref:hypothetical protein n=1 Tax=Ruegeria sp. HKCCA6837 TaxID=2682989 RepID=UPI0014887301